MSGGRRPAVRRVATIAALVILTACAGEEVPEATLSAAPPTEPIVEATGPAPPIDRPWPAAELHEGGTVAAAIGPGELHRWRLDLAEGDFLRLQVEQHDVDVALRWIDPGGVVVLTADRFINDRGPELVMAVAGTSGEHVLEITAFPQFGAGRVEATIVALHPAAADERLAADTYRDFRAAEELPRGDARAVHERCLEIWRRLGDDVLEGEVLFQMAGDHFLHREYGEGARRARKAAEAFARAGELRWEGLARNRTAVNLWSLAEDDATEQALTEYEAARALARRVGDPLLEGTALLELAQDHRVLGEVQGALNYAEAALAVLPKERSSNRAQALHNLGVLHSLYFHDYRRGARLLSAALETWPESDPLYERRKATTLNQLGRIALERGDSAAARQSFESALALNEGRDACRRAMILSRLALLEQSDDRPWRADSRRDEAREIVGQHDCPRSRATVHVLAARLAELRGDAPTAVAELELGRTDAERVGDTTTLAEVLTGLARIQRAQGSLEAALAANGRSLDLAEAIRPTVLREDLRTAFFATLEDRFDLQIELLATLGRDAQAWSVAETARGRALRDLLGEAGAGLRRGASPRLLDRERYLQRRLNRAAMRRQAEAEPDLATLTGLEQEIDDLVVELERVRGEVRRANPRYAEVTRPRFPSLAETQAQILEDNSLLVEYRLGRTTSWVWAIGRHSFSAHRLPARATIEALAGEAAGWARSLEWPGGNPPTLCQLSHLLLAPIADQLDAERLVLVLDGALESTPFAALPDPRSDCARAPPLIAQHEIVHLPSVATLTAQRRLQVDRPPGQTWVAVVADPVYESDDPRWVVPPVRRVPVPRKRDSDLFRRLPDAGREALAIVAVAPGHVVTATGLAASKRAITARSLAGARILHFAVHGVLDRTQPLLSRLVLSRFDPSGAQIDPFLNAHEIYDLELTAELVVLSACDTARGRQVAGEGLVAGLPRAFLYAGATRVLTSLWQVSDSSTADLMAEFYRRLVVLNEPPGRALRSAQQKLWRSGRRPRDWAGFVLQGDWRPLPPFVEPG